MKGVSKHLAGDRRHGGSESSTPLHCIESHRIAELISKNSNVEQEGGSNLLFSLVKMFDISAFVLPGRKGRLTQFNDKSTGRERIASCERPAEPLRSDDTKLSAFDGPRTPANMRAWGGDEAELSTPSKYFGIPKLA